MELVLAMRDDGLELRGSTNKPGKGLRIECRIPGADCNPYLGFAAALALSRPETSLST